MSKCTICNLDYNEGFRIPKVLPCGHTYCLICLLTTLEKNQAFVCRDCFQVIKGVSILEQLPNNYAILKCLGQRQAFKTKEFSPYTFLSQSTNNPVNDFQEALGFSPPSFEGPHSYSPSDSFNFEGFMTSLENRGGPNRDKQAILRSFTEPRKNRSKTPSRRINDIEITEMGIFREKVPQPKEGSNLAQPLPEPMFPNVPETCSIKSCNNPKLYMQGSLKPFCNIHCVQYLGNQYYGSQAREETKAPDMTQLQGRFKYDNRGPFGNGQSPINSQGSGSGQANANKQFMVQGFIKVPHKFGRPTGLNQIQAINKKPQGSSGAERMGNNSTNTAFSFAPKEERTADISKLAFKNFEPKVPFPQIREIPSSNQQGSQMKKKCVFPGCENEAYNYNGLSSPFCGRKCFQKWNSLPKETSFWS